MKDGLKGISIGEVAKRTGISVYRLRQWERRYDSPRSLKLESGHRRYPLDEVNRLLLVRQALELGERAHKVVSLSQKELEELLRRSGKMPVEALILDRWLTAIKEWDSAQLEYYFVEDWRTLGPIGFVSKRLALFLKRLGEAWVDQEISIAQEHFFSELLRSFLTQKWRGLSSLESGELFLLASPEGEEHDLALHMLAIVLTALKKRVLFLGTPTPIEEILRSQKENHPDAVCLSFSEHFSKRKAIQHIDELRERLSPRVDLFIGGEGAPHQIPKSVSSFADFESFADWIQYQWSSQSARKMSPDEELHQGEV